MSVVVGFIPTPVGRAALEAAGTEARLRGGPLIVLNVTQAGADADPRHADEDHLERIREHLRSLPVRVDVRQEVTQTSVVDALLETVRAEDAELLVIGVRRGREVARHLLGATAQRLVVEAPCDVLVV